MTAHMPDFPMGPPSPPQVSATPLRDGLRILFITMAIMWPLGFEQLFPLLLLAGFFLPRRSGGSFRMRKDIYMAGGAVFLLIYLLSGIGVFQPYRLMTFGRDFMIYATALMIMAHLRARARNTTLAEAIGPMALLYAVICGGGLIYLILPWEGFASPGYYMLPGSASDTIMAQRALVKSLGEQLYFYGYTNRVSSFFSSPIHFSGVLFLCMPFAASYARARAGRLGAIGVWLVMLIMVTAAQARIAMVFTLIWPIAYLTLNTILNRQRTALSQFAFLLVGLTVIGGAMILWPMIEDALRVFFLERRSGSAQTRIAIYDATVRMISERLFLGHGTQIDLPLIDYPAGSHSTFLGLWFKHGVFGFLLMSALLVAPVFSLLRRLRQPLSGALTQLHIALLSSYLLYLGLLVFNEYIADLYHTVLLFAFIAVVTGPRHITARPTNGQHAPDAHRIADKGSMGQSPGFQGEAP